MITYTHGNLLNADAEALVNTVNAVGVSGKGIALMFKEAFPENFRLYEAAAKAGRIAPGGLFVTERLDMLGPRLIINFATKHHWRNPSKIDWIRSGLLALRREIEERGLRSLALPPLGAGNGKLDWAEVRPLVADALEGLPCEITVYEPTAAYQNVVKRHGADKLTPSRALMAELVRQYEVLGFECSLLEAQKLAWFLNRGAARYHLPAPVHDGFAAHRYGPYSEGVRHLLDGLDGSYLACERRIADAGPTEPIRFRYERRDHVATYLTSPEAALYRPALTWTGDIIDGFQSPHGLELLATVDWLHQRQGAALVTKSMVEAIASWPGRDGSAERKRRIFETRDITIAIERLAQAEA